MKIPTSILLVLFVFLISGRCNGNDFKLTILLPETDSEKQIAVFSKQGIRYEFTNYDWLDTLAVSSTKQHSITLELPVEENGYFAEVRISNSTNKFEVWIEPNGSLEMDLSEPENPTYHGSGSVRQKYLVSDREIFQEYLNSSSKSAPNQLYDKRMRALEEYLRSNSEASHLYAYQQEALRSFKNTQLIAQAKELNNEGFKNLVQEDKLGESMNYFYLKSIVKWIELKPNSTAKEMIHPHSGQSSYVDYFNNYQIKLEGLPKKAKILLNMTLLFDYMMIPHNNQVDSLIEVFSKDLENNGNSDFFKQVYDTWRKISVGMIAPEFSIVDRNGKKVSLGNFKGKKILMDIWHTGCKPCIPARKKLKELENKTSDEVVFLYVSVDKDKEKWLRFLDKENKSNGFDLIDTDNPFQEKYRINSFPFYIIIDKNGKIQYVDGSNSDKVINEITELLMGKE